MAMNWHLSCYFDKFQLGVVSRTFLNLSLIHAKAFLLKNEAIALMQSICFAHIRSNSPISGELITVARAVSGLHLRPLPVIVKRKRQMTGLGSQWPTYEAG